MKAYSKVVAISVMLMLEFLIMTTSSYLATAILISSALITSIWAFSDSHRSSSIGVFKLTSVSIEIYEIETLLRKPSESLLNLTLTDSV